MCCVCFQVIDGRPRDMVIEFAVGASDRNDNTGTLHSVSQCNLVPSAQCPSGHSNLRSSNVGPGPGHGATRRSPPWWSTSTAFLQGSLGARVRGSPLRGSWGGRTTPSLPSSTSTATREGTWCMGTSSPVTCLFLNEGQALALRLERGLGERHELESPPLGDSSAHDPLPPFACDQRVRCLWLWLCLQVRPGPTRGCQAG